MNLDIQKLKERLTLMRWLAVGLLALAAVFSPAAGCAEGFSDLLSAKNMEVSVYPKNSSEPEAVWKISSISPEHRRMGFFSIKLLPVMVVDGVQLKFLKAGPQTNWLDGFRGDWAPAASRNIFEWRNFSVCFPQEKTPRVHANYVHPVANAGSLVCRIEGVTLQGGSRPIHLARAEVRTDGPAGEIVWRDAGATIKWDLFSGQFSTNTINLTDSK